LSTHPTWIAASESRLFGILHEARPSPKAGIVICAPFLHEYVRSHRLLALLAHELGGLGFRVLRFDYRGAGDSEGADVDFSLQHAEDDASAAVDTLRAGNPALPIIALGVRGGAFPSTQLMRKGKVDELWLWQPILDGADYVRQLREKDAQERLSNMRYRWAKVPGHGDAQTLMGYPCGPDLLDQLNRSTWSGAGIDASRVTLLDVTANEASPAHSRFFALPNSLSAWADELDMVRDPVAPVRTIASALDVTGVHS
jgi:uncharacterized protein